MIRNRHKPLLQKLICLLCFLQLGPLSSSVFAVDNFPIHITMNTSPYSEDPTNNWFERGKFYFFSWFNFDARIDSIQTFDFKKHPYNLENMLDLAGMSLDKIVTGYGLYPTIKTSFLHTRKLSEADRNYAYRMLRRQKANDQTAGGFFNRNLAAIVLEADYLLGEHYAINSVEVAILPVPNVYITAGLDIPPGPSSTSH